MKILHKFFSVLFLVCMFFSSAFGAAPTVIGTIANQTAYFNQTFSMDIPTYLIFEDLDGDPLNVTVTKANDADLPSWLNSEIVFPLFVGNCDTPGGAQEIYVVGNYAYIADGSAGLQIIDIGNPSNPSLIGNYSTLDVAYGVYVVGNLAFVVARTSGLLIIDISIPSSPSLVGACDTSGLAYGVYVVGNYAYVADDTAGLRIIDVSTPSSPSLVGTCNTPDHARDVYVSGNYAYVADGDSGLQIIDVNIPSNPNIVGAYDTSGSAKGVYVVGNYAYVADYDVDLKIIDVSIPSNPSLVETCDMPALTYGVYVVNDHAYVATYSYGLQIVDVSTLSNPNIVGAYDTQGHAYGVYVFDNYAYVADGAFGLQIIDIGKTIRLGGVPSISDAGILNLKAVATDGVDSISAPFSINILELLPTVSDFQVLGTEDTELTFNATTFTNHFSDFTGDDLEKIKLMSLPANGFLKLLSANVTANQEIDLSNIGNLTFTPVENWHGDTSFTWQGYGDGKYSNGTANVNIQIDAVNDPPTVIGTIANQTAYYNHTFEMDFLAYSVFEDLDGDPLNVTVTQANDTDLPSWLNFKSIPFPTALTGTYNTPGSAYGVHVVGNYVYMADGVSGLQIIDVNNPSSPSLVGAYDTSGEANGVYVVDNYAYVADGAAGLQIIDVSNPSSPSLAGTYDTSGEANGVYVVGNYAYVADGASGLQIINVSTPSNPSLVGTCDTTGAQGVYVIGNYAYVADYGAGLRVIDINTPSSPSIVGTYDTPNNASGVYVVDNYAYVVDTRSLQIVDISSPSSPSLVGTHNTPDITFGVYVVDDYAYVTSHTYGLRIIDVSVPSNPKLVGTYDTSGSARGVYVVGNYAYVASSNLKIINIDKRIRFSGTPSISDSGILNLKAIANDGADSVSTQFFVEISEPPPMVSDFQVLGLEDTELTFNATDFKTHFSDFTDDALEKIQIASLPSNGLLKLSSSNVTIDQEIDLSDIENLTFSPKANWYGGTNFGWKGYGDDKYSAKIANVNVQVDPVNDTPPIVIGTIFNQTTPYNQAFEMEFVKSSIFDDLVDGVNTLEVTVKQANDADLPSWLSSETVPSLNLVGSCDTSGAGGIYVVGNYAYVADGSAGLRIIDISIPSNPNLVGTYNTPGSAYGIYVVGNYAYIADYDAGLQIIDVSVPSNPSLVGMYNTPGNARDIYVVGNYAYVADWSAGLQIIDVSIPSNPSLVGTYNTPSSAYGVYVVANYAYVADGSAGLQIIDISIPSSPSLVGTCDTPGVAYRVYVAENYAYVADWTSGLQIVDISVPSNPSLIGGHDTSNLAAEVYVVGNYAYVADGSAGLQMIDISTCSNPNLVETYDTPDHAFGVHVVNNCAYVADRYSGLQVIKIDEKISLGGTPSVPGDIGILNLKAIASDGVDEVSTPFSINVLEPPPAVSDFQVLGLEDIDLTFNGTDFKNHFSDFTGDDLEKIQIMSLPPNGLLKFASSNVTVGQEVGVSNIGNLTFSPILDWNGQTNFTWKGYGDGKYSNGTANVDITISSVNDIPAISDVVKAGSEDIVLTFSASDFTSHFTDVENDGLTKIQITSLPANGVLKLSGTSVTLDQEIDAGDLGNLTFEPNENWSGVTSFSWKGYDGSDYSVASANVDITISSVNDVPVLSELSKSGSEDKVVTFSAEDFIDHFSDVEGDNLIKVQIMSLPANGVLKLLETPVTLDQEIEVNDLDSITFEPKKNWHGKTSFDWRGYDGVDYSEAVSVEIFIDEVDAKKPKDNTIADWMIWSAAGAIGAVAATTAIITTAIIVMKKKGLACFGESNADIELKDRKEFDRVELYTSWSADGDDGKDV